jgi:hypothetical protein
MNKKFMVTGFVLLAVLSLGSLLPAQGKAIEFKGILSDVRCWTAGTAGDGTDMRMNPEKHTVACLKMPDCMKSGYGIVMKDTAGKYEFYKFDAAGSKMAVDLLNKTTKTDKMMITVMGTKQKDMIEVESIVETQ